VTVTLEPFAWRRLTPKSLVEHRLDETGVLLLRGAAIEGPPLTTAQVRDGAGGFVVRSLDALHLEWHRAAGGDGWLLRTKGPAATMFALEERWHAMADQIGGPLGIDERLVLTTIACEVGDVEPDASGFVKAPRTELGYPRRTGEADRGDAARDAEDWAAYLAAGRKRGAHSSHGLMQTLLSTAYGVRPDLFAGVDPACFREVLWIPSNAIACGAGYMATFPEAVRTDPLALRFAYGAGHVIPRDGNPWGGRRYDDLVPLAFLAYWNDDACLRAGECIVVEHETRPRENQIAWLVLFALAGAACVAAGHRAAALRREGEPDASSIATA
jgi:hypothetical protein